MNPFQAAFLGFIEGLTEFLPVSSTFHLIFVSKLLQIPQSEFTKLFEIFIQAGAILSVIFLYVREVIGDRDLIRKTLAAFIPTALVGLILYKVIKNVFFNSSWLMLAVFIGVGVAFIVFELAVRKGLIKIGRNLAALTYKDAVMIGFVQALAVVPGVSRAGAVLVGMMLLGFKRGEAAKFSFILAVPTILAASALDLFKERAYLAQHLRELPLLAIGFVFALISAYFVVRWFIGFLQKNSLAPFGFYRIAVGILLAAFFLSGILS